MAPTTPTSSNVNVDKNDGTVIDTMNAFTNGNSDFHMSKISVLTPC